MKKSEEDFFNLFRKNPQYIQSCEKQQKLQWAKICDGSSQNKKKMKFISFKSSKFVEKHFNRFFELETSRFEFFLRDASEEVDLFF